MLAHITPNNLNHNKSTYEKTNTLPGFNFQSLLAYLDRKRKRETWNVLRILRVGRSAYQPCRHSSEPCRVKPQKGFRLLLWRRWWLWRRPWDLVAELRHRHRRNPHNLHPHKDRPFLGRREFPWRRALLCSLRFDTRNARPVRPLHSLSHTETPPVSLALVEIAPAPTLTNKNQNQKNEKIKPFM